ncbi:hypothetical protein OROHE_024482 [Orobanche hederae]
MARFAFEISNVRLKGAQLISIAVCHPPPPYSSALRQLSPTPPPLILQPQGFMRLVLRCDQFIRTLGELGCAQSLMPLAMGVRLTSHLSVNVRGCCELFHGTFRRSCQDR